jgi:septum formation inhibitor-activating ATPase MinD
MNSDQLRRAREAAYTLADLTATVTPASLSAEIEAAADEERAAIVAWLRREAEGFNFDYVLLDAANDIEAGAHRQS